MSQKSSVVVYDLIFGFLQQEIQWFSKKIFVLGVEGNSGPPPVPRRKDTKLPENTEYQTDKPKIQTHNINSWRVNR